MRKFKVWCDRLIIGTLFVVTTILLQNCELTDFIAELQGAPCTRVSQWGCVSAGMYYIGEYGELLCSAKENSPIFERCDDEDNDCDGLTDEDWPELGDACSAILLGYEVSGVWTCDSYTLESHCSADDEYMLNAVCEPTK